MTYEETEETNRIYIIEIIANFFVEFSDVIIDVDSFACFDAIFFEKKHVYSAIFDVIAIVEKRHLLGC